MSSARACTRRRSKAGNRSRSSTDLCPKPGKEQGCEPVLRSLQRALEEKVAVRIRWVSREHRRWGTFYAFGPVVRSGSDARTLTIDGTSRNRTAATGAGGSCSIASIGPVGRRPAAISSRAVRPGRAGHTPPRSDRSRLRAAGGSLGGHGRAPEGSPNITQIELASVSMEFNSKVSCIGSAVASTSSAACAWAISSTKRRIQPAWNAAMRSLTRPGCVPSSADAAAKKHPPGKMSLPT